VAEPFARNNSDARKGKCVTSRWLIIADDLTGAADCAIAFAKHGLESVVAWDQHREAGGVSVLSVDAGTRSLAPEQAAQLQVDVLASHYCPGLHLYKKIDSTLRGQPAAELAALLAYTPSYPDGRPRLAIVAPAFPLAGRVTVNGRIVVQGVPLEQAPLWAREHTYASADLVEVLCSAGLSAEKLSLATIAQGTEAVQERFACARRRGIAAVVCDAKTDADLAVVAAGSQAMSDEIFFVGSAGLAAQLAATESEELKPVPLPAHTGPKNVLIVVGSLAEASRVQARTLVQAGLVRHVVISPSTLLEGPCTQAWQERYKQLAQHLKAKEDVLLELELTDRPDLACGAKLAAKLAEFVTGAGSFGAIVATGGDTVYALLSNMGVHSIRLLDEVEPGMPLGQTVGAVSIPVVTKAGAFGDAHSLRRSLERLHC
jgi:uncharacterized protein YgbK (DUF1537 family)